MQRHHTTENLCLGRGKKQERVWAIYLMPQRWMMWAGLLYWSPELSCHLFFFFLPKMPQRYPEQKTLWQRHWLPFVLVGFRQNFFLCFSPKHWDGGKLKYDINKLPTWHMGLTSQTRLKTGRSWKLARFIFFCQLYKSVWILSGDYIFK